MDKRVWPGTLTILILGGILTWFSRSFDIFYFFLPLLIAHALFFRDPKPAVPPGRAVVSPAEGKVVEISTVRDDRFLKSEAVKVGIFLSIFDVHVTRAVAEGSVQYLQYVPGKFLNALDPKSAVQNESNWIGLEQESGRRVLIRQISGAIARRIYCDVKSGQKVERGEKLGIICYGSRVECYLPKADFEVTVQTGQRVHAGSSILGNWKS